MKENKTRILNARVTEAIYVMYEKKAKKERRKISQVVAIILEDAAKKWN